MGMLKRLFGKHAETRDNHTDEALVTHYYKTTKEKMFQEVNTLINADRDCELINESRERGEIAANLKGKRRGLIVATVISVRPYQTAVDWSISIDKGMNFGYCEEKIKDYYRKLDSEYTRVDA